ncbi:MAG: HEAT repeat domain-containing protein [Actinomycetota bacterium]|nr:HEAT repeat domain-containing protein [Actinomycetota bacterium]
MLRERDDESVCLALGGRLADPKIAGQAADVLVGRKRRDLLVEGLSHRSDRARTVAVSALARLGDPAAVEPLLGSLGDSSEDVRLAAVHALARLRDGRAVGPLGHALGDVSADVRYAAAGALSELGDRAAVEPLLATVAAESDERVRVRAVQTLGKLGDHRAIGPLTSFLSDNSPWLRDAPVGALEQLVKRAPKDIPGFEVAKTAVRRRRAGRLLAIAAGSVTGMSVGLVVAVPVAFLLEPYQDYLEKYYWLILIAFFATPALIARPAVRERITRRRVPVGRFYVSRRSYWGRHSPRGSHAVSAPSVSSSPSCLGCCCC